MEKGIKIYFDREADYLEILFEIRGGIFQETENDSVIKKVDGNVIGFSILNVSKLDGNSPELILKISGIILRNIGAPAKSQFL
jgi:hypothetical protein